MNESRKQFEQWFQNKYKCTADTMKVMQIKVELAWEAWQASRDAIEFKLPDQEKYEYWIGPKGEEEFDLVNFISDLSEAIRAAGIKVKE